MDSWNAAFFAAAQSGDLIKAAEALAAGADINTVNPYNSTCPALNTAWTSRMTLPFWPFATGAVLPNACNVLQSVCNVASRVAQSSFL